MAIYAEKAAFGERLRLATQKMGYDITPARLAKEFNRRTTGAAVTQQATRKWLLGEAIPAQDKVRVLARWLKCSPDWLRFGPYSGAAVAVTAEVAPAVALSAPVSDKNIAKNTTLTSLSSDDKFSVVQENSMQNAAEFVAREEDWPAEFAKLAPRHKEMITELIRALRAMERLR